VPLHSFIYVNWDEQVLFLFNYGLPFKADVDDGAEYLEWDGKGKVKSQRYGEVYPHEWIEKTFRYFLKHNNRDEKIGRIDMRRVIEKVKKKYGSDD
jgi:hypothetical protein